MESEIQGVDFWSLNTDVQVCSFLLCSVNYELQALWCRVYCRHSLSCLIWTQECASFGVATLAGLRALFLFIRCVGDVGDVEDCGDCDTCMYRGYFPARRERLELENR